MNESGPGVLCGMASGLARYGSGQAPNVNSGEDTGGCCEDVTPRTGWDFGKLRACGDTKTHTQLGFDEGFYDINVSLN